MEASTIGTVDPQPPAFRPGKKRKVYRHRDEDTDHTPSDAPLATPQPSSASDPRPSGDATETADADLDANDHLPVSSVIRLRQARKGRLGGVAFRAGSTTQADEQSQNTEQSLVPHDGIADNPITGGIAKRFAPQTGLVGELVNRHM